MKRIARLLEKNARYTLEELAVLLNITTEEAARLKKEAEDSGLIRGYMAIVDHEKLSENYVMAFIELKVTPKKNLGFDELAEHIAAFPDVQDVYLMSGGYDIALIVTGKTFKEIALFVSQRLAVLESVVSTATHFVLSPYKTKGILMGESKNDVRGNASL